MQAVIVALEVAKLQNGLPHKVVNARTVGIEAFAHQDCGIAPPLRPLAVWAVEVGVAHIDVERIECLLPETVEVFVVAGESALWQSVVARLTIGQALQLQTVREDDVDEISVHPSQRLVGLDALPGDVLGTNTGFATARNVVGMQLQQVAALIVAESDLRSDVHVVRQVSNEGVLTVTRTSLVLHFLQPEVLPKRNGTLDKRVPGTVARTSNLGRSPEAIELSSRLPRTDVQRAVIADAGLGKTEVGTRITAGTVSGMNAAQPFRIGIEIYGRSREEQTTLTAVNMRETTLAEIPEQDGNLIISLAKIGRELHYVEIGIVRVGATL